MTHSLFCEFVWFENRVCSPNSQNLKQTKKSYPCSVTGATITGLSPFDTAGSRDLHLRCEPSKAAEVTQYTWSDACRQKEESQCTIRPQPPWDDGKNITCTVNYKSGQSVTATFAIDLNCEYGSFFCCCCFLFVFFLFLFQFSSQVLWITGYHHTLNRLRLKSTPPPTQTYAEKHNTPPPHTHTHTKSKVLLSNIF